MLIMSIAKKYFFIFKQFNYTRALYVSYLLPTLHLPIYTFSNTLPSILHFTLYLISSKTQSLHSGLYQKHLPKPSILTKNTF